MNRLGRRDFLKWGIASGTAFLGWHLVEFEGSNLGVDHPYRWGLGGNLGPGQEATVTDGIRLQTPTPGRDYWVGLVQETVQWVPGQDGKGRTRISVLSLPHKVTVSPVTKNR